MLILINQSENVHSHSKYVIIIIIKATNSGKKAEVKHTHITFQYWTIFSCSITTTCELHTEL